MKQYLLPLVIMFIVSSCGDSKKDALLEKYNCSSLDDCLSKYEFEGARAYIALKKEQGVSELGDDDLWQGRGMHKIVEAESNYWVKEKEYKKALSVVDESANGYWGNEKVAQRFKLLSLIIDELIEDGDFEQAKIYALKASDEHTIDGWKETDTNDFDEEKTQQKVLLKKVETAEKLLSK